MGDKQGQSRGRGAIEHVKQSPKQKIKAPRAAAPEPVKESPSDIGATSKEKNNIVIPEFSAWLTLVLEQCRAENIRNLPRQRAPTPLFPERRPREACSMPISGCHDLPLATFNLPSRVFRHGCRRAECLERRWGGFFHTLSRGQDLPPATALRTNGNNTQNHRHSGISAARRRLSLELRLRCREATARGKTLPLATFKKQNSSSQGGTNLGDKIRVSASPWG